MQTDATRVSAVTVQNVSKRFRTPEEAAHTLKERVLHPLSRRGHHDFVALRDVSFHVEKGEFFGIVGRNGSGKSTLLKCIAGIYGVNEGQMFRSGRMATFIELGVGFNPDLAAYDNVVLNGIMMGLTAAEAKARYRRVIEFAELEDFQDLKLKNYSSGMHVRLAFSVAIQVDADILLIDEVLAVGDAAFQQKCFDVFNRLRDEGRTILFVTHDMSSVNRFCHRALLLDHGELVAIGAPAEIGDRYLELNFEAQATAARKDGARAGDGAARIVDAWIEDETGERQNYFLQGTRPTFRGVLEFFEEIADPSLTVAFQNETGLNVCIVTTIIDHETTGTYHPGDRVTFSVTFDNVLGPGRYRPLANLARRGGGHDLIDRWEKQMSFVVASARATGGLVDIAYEWTIERSGAGRPVPSGA
ncbi:MAG TPA: ABC transporter ATP-binding protein [Solirubrobacteraceae bacterium]|jgi:ABC-type polysaccharide/polyol phosphate transport system ATPase subunit|nr:ABC transporter ATP-binding protein [Solirubrobacteraceae bacterium]